jgi:hypothetical protein
MGRGHHPAGAPIPYADLKTLDLRKWETKGLAFIDYDGSSGKGRIRIDGLTYGGFKKDQGEPAERLMKLIRSRFSGEILEYAPLVETAAGGEGGNWPAALNRKFPSAAFSSFVLFSGLQSRPGTR